MQVYSRYIISILLVLLSSLAFAQKPTGSPSLPDDNFYHIPVLKQGQKPEDYIRSNIFLQASSSKSAVFTGEPFLVEYKFYIAITSEPSPGTEPTFNGCSVVELPGLADTNIAIVGGKRFHVIPMRQVQLTPLQDGPLILSEASVNNIVQLITPDDPTHVKDFSYTATSSPVTVTVKPLPEQNKPIGFSGLVGHFTIKAKTDSASVPSGENTHLIISVKGTGNIEALSMPVVEWPGSIHHYDVSDTEIAQKDTFPINSSKTFTVPIICTKEGPVVIPPVSLCYFDPMAEKYVTIHTDSVQLQVTKPLPKQAPKETDIPNTGNTKYLWIVAAIAIGAIIGLFIAFARQKKQKNKEALQEQAQKEPEPAIVPYKPLPINFAVALQMVKLKEKDRDFYVSAKELLVKAIQHKLGTAVLHEADILQELERKMQDENMSAISIHIFTVCNRAAYSPIGDTQRAEIFEMLSGVIVKLDV